MRDHIKILGILNILMGGLTALLGIAVLVFAGALAGVIAASLRSAIGDEVNSALIAAPVIASIGVAIAIFFLLLAAPSLIGGIGLLYFKSWSRVWMIIVSAFHLLHVPLGTALGVYGLIILLNEDTQRILESGGTLPSGASYSQPSRQY